MLCTIVSWCPLSNDRAPRNRQLGEMPVWWGGRSSYQRRAAGTGDGSLLQALGMAGQPGCRRGAPAHSWGHGMALEEKGTGSALPHSPALTHLLAGNMEGLLLIPF